MRSPTPAQRLDEAIDRILAGDRPVVEPELRPLVDAATLLTSALPPLPAGSRFEARVAARLAASTPLARAAEAVGAIARRELRHPGRLIAAGAVSSAAVGVTVTALAVWRTSRRHGAAARAAHR
ncbi:MAG TPA: hypothetical protein VGB34_05030 [Candidatus Limnocylindria bacterium]|jgi:hypothetical protein